MKLSLKFFCVAYIIVLLSTGIGGFFMINNINNTLFNAQTEKVNTAINYAANSFTAFSDISFGEMEKDQIKSIKNQIKSALNGTVYELNILDSNTIEKEYLTLKDNSYKSSFLKQENKIIMKSVCKIGNGNNSYFIVALSDFTDIKNQCDLFLRLYGIVVFSISAISGFLLFCLTKKITTPLQKLTKATDEIALGNFGEKVNIKTSDYEIKNLSESFNSMSLAIEQKITEIQEETKKRDVFVSDFTHELKTPMTSIIGYSQMLSSYALSDDEKRESANAIYNEAKRLEKLSLQLLDLYVYKNEKIDLESINLLEIEDKLNATLKFLAIKYDVLYSVKFSEQTVLANSVLLLSLLYNLADNAFKASNPKSMVEIYSEIKDDDILICVKDFGKGISKENIKYLTEPFYREDKSRSRKLGGAGLGLSLCKEIALLHNTSLNFETEKDKGTTVSFLLKKGGIKNEQN